MRVTGTRLMNEFTKQYPGAEGPFAAWKVRLTSRRFYNVADIRSAFRHVDVVGPWTLFTLHGTAYRLIATVDFTSQTCHVETALTHAQYDKKHWMETHYWAPTEHLGTITPLQDEADYDAALAALTRLGKRGAAASTHAQNALLGRLLCAVHAYEERYHPFG